MSNVDQKYQANKNNPANKSLLLFTLFLIISIAISFSLCKFLYPSKKLAYIDSARLMVGFSEANVIEKELKAEDEKWKVQFKAFEDSLQSAIDVMSKEYDNAPSARKKELQDMLSARNQQLNNFKQANLRKMENLKQEKMKSVIDKMNVYVTEYGKKHKYDLIFATSAGNIVYANQETMDVTEDIIKGLNERYK